MSNGKDDVEALLYPAMEERPEMRWAFIRKVYSILIVQLLATVAVAAAVTSHPSVAIFIAATWAGWAVYLLILIALIVVLVLLSFYHQKHPINFLLLGLYTLCFGLLLGLAASFVIGTTIMEAAIATAVVVISLTLYTFWAAKRGEDFGFLVPFLLTTIIILLLFTLFQIFFPMRRFTDVIYSGFGVLIFSVYIIIHTNILIKRNTYDEYIWASIMIYLDILNIFVRLIRIFGRVKR